ncbi:hypothetical protein HZB00_02755 [Candidatus Woesearchaeota archaeon]|nr:hypothetical protein [Candidatus Woesearchaeota archaeon]
MEQKTGTREYLLLGMVGLILALAIFQSFQIRGLKTAQPATLQTASSGAVDMTGWTADEKMQYEHHGTLPARSGGGQSPSSGGMVGGC